MNRALEMAKRFPHVNVLGVDLAPSPVDRSECPDNLSFEIDDVNHGLEHFHGRFDIVHVRNVGAGIRDFGKMMQDAERCLKPGGLVIFMGADRTLWSEDRLKGAKFPVDDSDTTGSWTRKLVWGM
jgi:SAM-dependent methyltransferase